VRWQTIVVAIAVALWLWEPPGFAVGDACGLSYAKPGLTALSEANTFRQLDSADTVELALVASGSYL
jgi:hypothetical protein